MDNLPSAAGRASMAQCQTRMRIIPHEAVPRCGSFEVRFPDGRASRFFYWDDIPRRRLRPELVDGATAKRDVMSFARAE